MFISVKNFNPIASIKNDKMIDVGLKTPGGWSAGKELINLFMGGMGYVNFGELSLKDFAFPTVDTYFDNPAQVCLSSFLNKKNVDKYTMVGPDSRGDEDFCYFETEEVPQELQETEQTIIVASPQSLVSAIYNSALVVPLAVKKLVDFGMNLEQIEWAWGTCPLATLSEQADLVAERKQEALEYGGVASIWVRSEDSILEEIAHKWEGLGEIRLHNLQTAKTHIGGKIDEEALIKIML